MPEQYCEICRCRPATTQSRVSQLGQEHLMFLCERDYKRLQDGANRVTFETLKTELLSGFLQDNPLQRAASVFAEHSRKKNRPIDIMDHFSEQSKDLLKQASIKAADSGKNEVDSEHLLYKLVDTAVVQAILKQLKLSAADLKGYIDANFCQQASSANPTKELPISPRVKGALQLALSASQDLGRDIVGPEHMLIGLMEEEDGLAGQILKKYGLTAQQIREEAARVAGANPDEAKDKRSSNTPRLDKFSRDLTGLARKGKLDPVIGRAQEIATVIEVLARRKKNNPVLIGEPGVGKTAIIEGLAQRIISGDVPEVLRNKRIVELNVNSIVAGSKYRGDFEQRIKNILDEINKNAETLIVFIDEIHTIVGAGQGIEGGLDIANTFKPALSRGDLHLIGATTLSEYQKYIEKDAALERRFQPVMIAEPSLEQTMAILRGLRDKFEAHHKVVITDEALLAAIEFSERYIANRFLPDKAIELIDQAAARVRINMTSRPPEIQELEGEILQLERELDYAKSHQLIDKRNQLEAQLRVNNSKLEQLLGTWKSLIATGSREVAVEHVAEIVSNLSGVPLTTLTAEERQRLLQMEERLHERVIGQDEAIQAVSDAVRLARAGLREGKKPIATFMFLGPTGVGKTELAKALAEIVFGREDALVRIDMSEYTEKQSVSRLIGAPPGYIGFEEGGQLTERVRRKPYCVILFDELEKAHTEVLNTLLQLFDDGRLTDGKGRLVDFTNTIIICTTNVGGTVIRESLQLKRSYDDLKTDVMFFVNGHFRPEFINRIDDIILFHPLDREQISQIVKLQLEQLRRIALGQGLLISFDQSVIDHLAEVGYIPEFGARELKRKIRAEIYAKLASFMLKGEFRAGDSVSVRYDQASNAVRLDKQNFDHHTAGAA